MKCKKRVRKEEGDHHPLWDEWVGNYRKFSFWGTKCDSESPEGRWVRQVGSSLCRCWWSEIEESHMLSPRWQFLP